MKQLRILTGASIAAALIAGVTLALIPFPASLAQSRNGRSTPPSRGESPRLMVQFNQAPRGGNGAQQPGRRPPAPPQRSEPGEPGNDPTQAPPNVRRILEGDARPDQRQELPTMEVVGKVVQSSGRGKALLKIDERIHLIAEGSRFRVNTGGAAGIVFTVRRIDVEGVEVVSSEDNQTLRLP